MYLNMVQDGCYMSREMNSVQGNLGRLLGGVNNESVPYFIQTCLLSSSQSVIGGP